MSHDSSGKWIAEAVQLGCELIDVDEMLGEIAKHVTTKGEWEKGVISPSLIGRVCRLQRLKVFLGHPAMPGVPNHMASSMGLPSSIGLINMTRGFLAEGLIVTALIRALGDRVLAHAPTFAPRYVDPQTNQIHTGHPDILVIGEDGQPELIQVKCPSVNKFERAVKMGDEDALETYMPQMVEEMFITRNCAPDGMSTITNAVSSLVVRNNLVLFAWEHTGKDTKPRVRVVPLDWHESLSTIPLTAAAEIEEDVAAALAMGVWPEAYPEHQWNTWPCAYCPFSRLGDYTDPDKILPKCDDHERWM